MVGRLGTDSMCGTNVHKLAMVCGVLDAWHSIKRFGMVQDACVIVNLRQCHTAWLGIIAQF